MKKEIKVLDHGYVKYIDHMGSDESVIEAARMSTGKGFLGWDTDAKLLEYLYENRHMTPFECGGELQVEIQAPIFVFRQIMRHRTFSFNEFSARYTKMPNIHYLPDLNRLNTQSKSNKQSSSTDLIPDYLQEMFLEKTKEEQDQIYDTYKYFTSKKLSREIARINCPVSRYSKIRAKTDLRNWLHFLGLRMDKHAQWETQQYANAAAEIIKEIWPRTFELFEEYSLYSVTLSRTERKELSDFLSHVSVMDPNILKIIAKLRG